MEQRVQLLQAGLGERVPTVKENAILLLKIWLTDSCNNDVRQLLSLLDCTQHSGKQIPQDPCIMQRGLHCGVQWRVVKSDCLLGPLLSWRLAQHLDFATIAAAWIALRYNHLAPGPADRGMLHQSYRRTIVACTV